MLLMQGNASTAEELIYFIMWLNNSVLENNRLQTWFLRGLLAAYGLKIVLH